MIAVVRIAGQAGIRTDVEETLKRLISGGAGLVFRGPGFYCTDHMKVKK